MGGKEKPRGGGALKRNSISGFLRDQRQQAVLKGLPPYRLPLHQGIVDPESEEADRRKSVGA